MGYFSATSGGDCLHWMHATVTTSGNLRVFRSASFSLFLSQGEIAAIVEPMMKLAKPNLKSRKVLEEHGSVKGIYVATANSMP